MYTDFDVFVYRNSWFFNITISATGIDREYFDSEDYKFESAIALGDDDGVEEEEYQDLGPFEKHIKRCKLEDITPEKNGKVWKRVVREGVDNKVSDASLVRGMLSTNNICQFG